MSDDSHHGEDMPLMPVRSLHNYVYCPRLFYMQWVECLFAENEDTVKGSAIHRRVDCPSFQNVFEYEERLGTVRSQELSSERYGLVGVVDLVEEEETGWVRIVDYKKGSPFRGDTGEWEAKESDSIQLAAYALMLQEKGLFVREACVFYAGVKRRVSVSLTEKLFSRCLGYIKEARTVASGRLCPPPLADAMRCFACSLYPLCLPGESRYWMRLSEANKTMRPPLAGGDEGEIVIVQHPQAHVSLQGGKLIVRVGGEMMSKHPIRQIQGVYLYGAVQVSTQALYCLMERGTPVSYFSPSGRFIGLSHGLQSSGVDARMGQYTVYRMQERRLILAREIIRAKIHNQRVVLMRNGKAPDDRLKKLAAFRDACATQPSLDALRGVEGSAASLYFRYFATMIKVATPDFFFEERNRRPPRDPVNALLSFSYSVLCKELTGLAYAVGLDPFLGFFHSPGYGRAALALDMMEEFRPLIADSVVLTLINRGELAAEDFVSTARGCYLKEDGRRRFWRAWIRRLDTQVTHPAFGYKMSYRRMLEVQMRQLWRFFRGDMDSFRSFTTR